MAKLIDIKENTQYTEVYNKIQLAIEAYSRLSPNIPKALLEVSQHIYGRLDTVCYNVFSASNTLDIEEKKLKLLLAKDDILFIFSSIELLVKSKSITIGGANTVLINLKIAFDQTRKWLNAINKVH